MWLLVIRDERLSYSLRTRKPLSAVRRPDLRIIETLGSLEGRNHEKPRRGPLGRTPSGTRATGKITGYQQ